DLLRRLLVLDRLGSRSAFLGAFRFAQAGSFALEIAQVEQLGAPHLAGTHDFHLVHDFGVEREDTFYTLAKADFADGEAAAGTVAPRNDRALKRLHALFVALFNPDLHADSVAGINFGKVLALQLGSKFFHDGMLGHD